MIASDILRGNTEMIILSQLVGNDSYGYQINKNILMKSNGELELKEATLYTVFRRLEEAGEIESYWGDENTGARRKYYSITEKGMQTLNKLTDEWEKAKATIDNLIVGEVNDDE